MMLQLWLVCSILLLRTTAVWPVELWCQDSFLVTFSYLVIDMYMLQCDVCWCGIVATLMSGLACVL